MFISNLRPGPAAARACDAVFPLAEAVMLTSKAAIAMLAMKSDDRGRRRVRMRMSVPPRALTEPGA
jgi:hypothetical protein